MHGGHLYHLHHNPPSSDDGSNKKTKRGVLPKQATEILRSWLFSHIVVSFLLISGDELTAICLPKVFQTVIFI